MVVMNLRVLRCALSIIPSHKENLSLYISLKIRVVAGAIETGIYPLFLWAELLLNFS